MYYSIHVVYNQLKAGHPLDNNLPIIKPDRIVSIVNALNSLFLNYLRAIYFNVNHVNQIICLRYITLLFCENLKSPT